MKYSGKNCGEDWEGDAGSDGTLGNSGNAGTGKAGIWAKSAQGSALVALIQRARKLPLRENGTVRNVGNPRSLSRWNGLMPAAAGRWHRVQTGPLR